MEDVARGTGTTSACWRNRDNRCRSAHLRWRRRLNLLGKSVKGRYRRHVDQTRRSHLNWCALLRLIRRGLGLVFRKVGHLHELDGRRSFLRWWRRGTFLKKLRKQKDTSVYQKGKNNTDNQCGPHGR